MPTSCVSFFMASLTLVSVTFFLPVESAGVDSVVLLPGSVLGVSPRGAPLPVSAVISDTCRPSPLTTALEANPSSCVFDSAFLISSPRKRLSVEFRCVKYRKGVARPKRSTPAPDFSCE